MLLHSWHGSRGTRFLSDVIVNVCLYIPLGAVALMALRRPDLPLKNAARFSLAVLLGALVSAGIEMAQLFVPGRFCNSFDLANNILGTGIGATAAITSARLQSVVRSAGRVRIRDQAAMVLLLVWVASLSFPFFPVTKRSLIWAGTVNFLRSDIFGFVPFFSALGSWLAAGLLMKAAGVRTVSRWLLISLLLVPMQVLVIAHRPQLAELAGAWAAFALFVKFGSAKVFRAGAAWGFLALLLLRGLWPFQLTSPHAFEWIPFAGFLEEGTWQGGVAVLLAKIFYYGSAVWLMKSQFRLPISAAIVMTTLLLIELTQTRLPGRVPEIADPIIAGLMAYGISVLSKARR